MKQLLRCAMLSIALQGSLFALDLDLSNQKEEMMSAYSQNPLHQYSSSSYTTACRPGPVGPIGQTGPQGLPGPNFGQYACLYSSVAQTLADGQNVLFGNQVSLAGITYNSTTGVFTLQPGTYSVTYFSTPIGSISSASELNIVANGSIIPNSPLGGSATIVTLSNAVNTLALQAQAAITLSLPSTPATCNAMITIYQID